MFDVVLTVRDNDDYRQAMTAIMNHEFDDVGLITDDPGVVPRQLRVNFLGKKTRNTDAHAYFSKRGILTHVELA